MICAPSFPRASVATACLALLLGCGLPTPGGAAPALELTDCRISAGPGFPSIAARCGQLSRPLDPSDPESVSIDLAVAVVPALTLDPAPDPLLVIAGGPGQSSISFFGAYSVAFAAIRRERDIVLMDQRGTGQSAALDCDAPAEDVVGGRMETARVAEEAQRCLDALPYDPRFFTTSIAVTDLAALRAALEYSAFNIYGISYGTRVAQHFLRRFPELTRSVILDGVVPPTLALGPDIALAAQDALDVVLASCEEQTGCNDAFPALREELSFLQKQLRDHPVEVHILHPLTAEPSTITLDDLGLAGVIRLLSYHSGSIALIPLLIHSAAAGNLIPLASQFQMSSESMEKSMSIGMHNSVVCTEDVPFYSSLEVDEDEIAATYIGLSQLEVLTAMCAIWPAGIIDDDFKEALKSDKPVLLLSGDADPVTPPRFAEQAAEHLSASLHIVGKKQGHGLGARGCTPDIMADFVKSGSVDDLDTECLLRVHAMPFFLSFSGPGP